MQILTHPTSPSRADASPPYSASLVFCTPLMWMNMYCCPHERGTIPMTILTFTGGWASYAVSLDGGRQGKRGSQLPGKNFQDGVGSTWGWGDGDRLLTQAISPSKTTTASNTSPSSCEEPTPKQAPAWSRESRNPAPETGETREASSSSPSSIIRVADLCFILVIVIITIIVFIYGFIVVITIIVFIYGVIIVVTDVLSA